MVDVQSILYEKPPRELRKMGTYGERGFNLRELTESVQLEQETSWNTQGNSMPIFGTPINN